MGTGSNLDRAAQIVSATLARRARRPAWRIGRNMHLLAFRHERESGQRISILSTNQHSDAADVACYDSQPTRVSISPYQLLVKHGYQLAVQIEDGAVGPDVDVRIPQAADARLRSFK